jgi:hypothetical protein
LSSVSAGESGDPAAAAGEPASASDTTLDKTSAAASDDRTPRSDTARR